MAKQYPIVDVTGNGVLNPGPNPNDIYPRPIGWIERIAVHHEAQFRPHDYDSVARYESEANYQNNSSLVGSRGIQYHYHIDNQGTIFYMRPLDVMLWHCGDYSWNQRTIAICVDGNFETQQPTQEQFEALKQLLDNLCTQHPEFPASQPDVYPHQAFSATACCGANLVPFVNQYRIANGNVGIPQVGYDWPEDQPQQPAPVPTPAPEPPKNKPDYIGNAQAFPAIRNMVAKEEVSLFNLTNDTVERTYAVGQEFQIGSQTVHAGVTYYITQYSTQKGIWKGLDASKLKDKSASMPEPTQGTTEPPTQIPVDVTPTPPSNKDQEQDQKIGALQVAWGTLLDLFKSIADAISNFLNRNKK